MRSWLLILGFVVSLLPAGAFAGAWPRDEGRWFLSMSQTFVPWDGGATGWSGLYLEHGLSPRLTFGLDGGRAMDTGRGQALALLRWDLAPAAPLRLGASLGLGAADGPAGREGLVQARLAVGRRLDRPDGGWAEAELGVTHRLGRDETVWSADLTLGLGLGRRGKAILQVNLQSAPRGATARLVPAYVRRVSARGQVLIGLTADLTGDEPLGVKLGTWIDF